MNDAIFLEQLCLIDSRYRAIVYAQDSSCVPDDLWLSFRESVLSSEAGATIGDIRKT